MGRQSYLPGPPPHSGRISFGVTRPPSKVSRFQRLTGRGCCLPTGLTAALELLKDVTDKREGISYADVFQLASATAIELAGGPKIPLRFGRRDARTEEDCCPEGRLPGESCFHYKAQPVVSVHAGGNLVTCGGSASETDGAPAGHGGPTAHTAQLFTTVHANTCNHDGSISPDGRCGCLLVPRPRPGVVP